MRARISRAMALGVSGLLVLAACGESHTADEDDETETDAASVVGARDPSTRAASADAAVTPSDAGADAVVDAPRGPKPSADAGTRMPGGMMGMPGLMDGGMLDPMRDGGGHGPGGKPSDAGKGTPGDKLPDAGKPMPDGGKPMPGPMGMPGGAMPDAAPPGSDAA